MCETVLKVFFLVSALVVLAILGRAIYQADKLPESIGGYQPEPDSNEKPVPPGNE